MDDLEKRLTELERLVQVHKENKLAHIEWLSIRITAFVLLELFLLGVVMWSLFHIATFVRAAGS